MPQGTSGNKAWMSNVITPLEILYDWAYVNICKVSHRIQKKVLTLAQRAFQWETLSTAKSFNHLMNTLYIVMNRLLCIMYCAVITWLQAIRGILMLMNRNTHPNKQNWVVTHWIQVVSGSQNTCPWYQHMKTMRNYLGMVVCRPPAQFRYLAK